MALIKAKQINTDVSANYWNIVGFNYDKPSRTLEVRLCLYTSEQSRLAGDAPIKPTDNIQINNVSPSDLEDNPFSFAYAKLKTDPTIFPVLLSPEVPEVTETNQETGEITVITPKVEAIYKSFFEDAENNI